jgi:hypothetical protein
VRMIAAITNTYHMPHRTTFTFKITIMIVLCMVNMA